MASTGLKITLFASLAFLLGACGNHEELPDVYLLTGACKIEVSTPEEGTEILVDGILVGRGRVTTSLPCGQKLVEVKHQGYKPYRAYHQAIQAKTLLVPVKLEPLAKREVYALSDKVLEDIKAGKIAKGAVEGGASAAAAPEGEAAVAEVINWDDWS